METRTINKQTLVERLTQRMDLHRIFLFPYPLPEGEQQHLLLVVNPVKGLAPKTLAPLVSLCFSDAEAIPFDMVIAGEWQNQLKHGSLYYTYASLPQHELFVASKKNNPLFSHKTIGGLLELAELNYEKCRKGSDEFREGVDNFLDKGDYGQATFMLHQFLELRVKGFQATAGINGGKSHNVEHLLKSLLGILPQLQSTFPYDSLSVDLLRLLDQSYVKAKKQETIDITPEEFGILLYKCEEAKAAMDGTVAMMVARITAYREQLPVEAEKQSEPNQTPKGVPATATTTAHTTQVICEDFSGFPWPDRYKQDANLLIEAIRQKHNPEQITLLNYHTDSFSGDYLFNGASKEKKRVQVELHLVVLMKRIGPFRFRTLKVGVVNAAIVFQQADVLANRLAEGNRFANTFWTKGRVIRRKSTFEPSYTVSGVDWRAEYEQTETAWLNAKACMNNLDSVIQNIPSPMQDTALLLLRSLLEIGIHTYLRCAVGYVPKAMSIVELINWSGIVDRQLVNFVYPTCEAEQVRLRMMINPEIVWWQNVEGGSPDTPQSFYREKAREMIKFFEGLCKGVLDEMEGKIGAR